MDNLRLEDFKSKYFYKVELIYICKKYGLPTYGTKAELNQYIINYLSGIPINKIKPFRNPSKIKKLKYEDIHLDTKIVGSGFSFNNDARKFFAEYYNISKFSFKKEMAIIKRKAEKEKDLSMTVKDLIKGYEKSSNSSNRSKAISNTAEEHTYEWNNFVKDFCNSYQSTKFKNKLKVASILWRHVKNTTAEKKFNDNLLNEFDSEIKQYKKGV